MDELKKTEISTETEPVNETAPLKERKKLKESNTFKFIIYVLFFVSCAAGIIFGYFIKAEYYIGAYDEENGIDGLYDKISESKEEELCYHTRDLVDIFLDDIFENYNVDYSAIEKMVNDMDTNEDDVVDETDLQSYLKDNADLYYDEYGLEANLDETYEGQYTDVLLSITIDDEVVIEEKYSDVPDDYDPQDYLYTEYSYTYDVPELIVHKFDSYADIKNYYGSYEFDLYESSSYYNAEYEYTWSSKFPDTIFDFDYNYADFADLNGQLLLYYNGEEYDFTSLQFASDYIEYDDGSVLYWDCDAGWGTFYPVVTDGYLVIEEYDNVIPINYTVSSNAYIYDLNTADDNNGSYVSFVVSRNIFAIGLIVSIIAAICLAIISMILSGSKNGLRKIEKTPTEIILVGMGCLIILLLYMIDSDSYDINIWTCFDIVRGIMEFLNGKIISYGMYIFGNLIGIACIITVGLLLINNLLAKAKSNSVLKSFLIIRICKAIYKHAKNIVPKISFKVKAIVTYIIITIVEIFVLIFLMAMQNQELCVVTYIILKVIIIIALIVMTYILQILSKGGEKLAEGDYTYKVDTKYMFGVFKKHAENLNNINVGMQNAVEERTKSERMKAELITNVSHDIKTPVTSIVNYVDLLQKENIDHEPEASYIEVLARQSAKLKKLVENLVEASKASTGNVKMTFANVDVNMLVEQSVAEYIDKLSGKNISVITKLSSDKAFIMADGKYLWRVFDNLLNNALKYTMPATRMYINTYITDASGTVIKDIATSMSEPAKVVIEFKNISKDELNISSDEIMERFVRGDSSRNTEGSGLGLSIAKNLCQLQNATFDIIIDGDLFKACITFDYSPEQPPEFPPEVDEMAVI